jgi:predicted aminopeptidase
LKKTPQHSIDIAILDMKIIKSTRKLNDRSIDSELYVGKMKSTRDDLRSAMYNLHKATNEKKAGSATSSEELAAKIIQLKRNIAAGQEEISAIFADINNAKPNSA